MMMYYYTFVIYKNKQKCQVLMLLVCTTVEKLKIYTKD